MSRLQPVRDFLRLLLDAYRRGGIAFAAAPALVALALLPELAQHCAELWLGMFDSREAFRAYADSPLRMGFGYAKIAGLTLAFLAIARFWWLDRSAIRAMRIGPWHALRLVVAIALYIASGLPFEWLQARAGSAALGAAIAVTAFAVQSLLLVPLVAILFDDRRQKLRRLVVTGWRAALVLLPLIPLVAAPSFALHYGLHWLALRTPFAIDVALMLFDAVAVGYLAACCGAALELGYRWGTRRDTIAAMDTEPANNPAESRYEMQVEGHTAFAAYRLDGEVITFTHTIVPKELGGRGIASRLIGHALADARAKGLKVVPQCPFVAAYIDKHPEERDLLA